MSSRDRWALLLLLMRVHRRLLLGRHHPVHTLLLCDLRAQGGRRQSDSAPRRGAANGARKGGKGEAHRLRSRTGSPRSGALLIPFIAVARRCPLLHLGP